MNFKKRALSVLLSVAMICNICVSPVLAYAATGDTPIGASSICEHHPAHTADCGYTEVTVGTPCAHTHTADCYSAELICGLTEKVVDNGSSDTTHTHTQECYKLVCPHVHDTACGYMEKTAGTPCTYECLICNPKDTLPPAPMAANAATAKANKGADAITIKINDVAAEHGGATFESAVTASGAAANTITKLTITKGEVTAADWTYFAGGTPGTTTSPFTALTDFTVDAAVTAVADIPNGGFGKPIFPKTIVNVTIPKATTIGNFAFFGCTSLIAASIPQATSIGMFAFFGCAALATATFPQATTIGEAAFSCCDALTTAAFLTATTIEMEAFSECRVLKTASFPVATSISDGAFLICVALAELKLGATVPTTIGTEAFKNCPATRNLVLVDTDGTTPLTGGALTTAQTNYDAVATGGGTATDGFWYGWKVRDAVTPPVVGAFTVTGGTNGTDYSYANNTLTINSGTALTISTTTPTTTDKIVVANGANANVTLDGVSINMSGTDYACAFEILGNATCNLTIIGNNTLKSGNHRAGLQVPVGATLTIGGTGTLNVSAENYGAGIGGAENGASGTITINSGTVTATGKNDGAGIGSGGRGAACGTITINGGVVKATGGAITAIGDGNGAGIGGGTNGSGGIITINGGAVTATGGGSGAGIGGGGEGGAGGEITISGGVVTAIGGNLAAGIGGSYRGAGGTISINGGIVTATGGSISATLGDGNGAGIGGGSGSAGGTITISGGTVKATGGTTIGTSMQPTIGNGIGDGYNGTAATFSTGTSGNAFIDSTGISDQNSKTNWNGVIFENNIGKVYGAPVTLTTNAEIPSGKTLKVEKGETIIVGTGVTLTNNGTITNNGIINNSGTINGGGTVGGTGTITTVTAVMVSPANVSIEIGEKQQLTATVVGTNNPAQTVAWASSNPAVATVSASGLVTAVANGTATITAVSVLDTIKKGAVAVTVAPPTPIAPPVPPSQPNGNTTVIDHENNFWISVVSLIQSTKKGDVLKIDTGAYTKMPACVMEELRIKGAGMIIKWNGGKNIVIPVGKALGAEKNRDVWALAELAKMYNKYSLRNKTNPKTGVDTYEIVDTQKGETTPITGSIIDATTTQGSQTGKYILVMVAGTLIAAVTAFGVCIWTRKKENEEEKN